MKWNEPLIEATILKRYKRFLADVIIDGKVVTAHVPNTGSMTTCWEANWKCALSLSTNPDRKMPHTLELTHNGETWIGVNTANANKLAKIALAQGFIPELSGYQTIIPEKKIGESRVDFYLEKHPHLPSCFVEVKSVTLKRDGRAQFPDAITERGQKHLRELMDIKKSGLRAAMLFVIQREDVDIFSPAISIDSTYAELLSLAHKNGVEIFAYRCKMGLRELSMEKSLPIELC